MNQSNHHQAELPSVLIKVTSKPKEKAQRENLVILPTYNEAINLQLLVPSILRRGPFDVLIVDDNSLDGTGEVAESLAKRFPGRVDVLHRPGKLGLGTAYLAGFHYALAMGYQRVFTMDADFSHEPSYLPTLQEALDDADVVLGSRYVPGGGTMRWSLRRRLLSRGGSTYARLMLDLPIHDLTSGFKGFRRQVLETLIPELDTMLSNGYAFQIEMTYLCSSHGLRMVEVPIIFEERLVGKSKMNWHIIAEALWIVWVLRLNKGSVRSLRNAHPRLPLGRAMAAIIALVSLIVLVTVNGAPGRLSHLARGASKQTAALSNLRPSPTVGSRSLPSKHSAFLQLQGTDLTFNVPLRFAVSGFLPGEGLKVTIQNQKGRPEAQLDPTVADKAGKISSMVEAIPADLTPGTYVLLVEGMKSHRRAQANFQMHWIPPTVLLDTYSVKPEQGFSFSGSGFMPNEVVEVHLNSPTGDRLATTSANAMGNVKGHVMVPLLPEGNYSLFFVGRQSQTPASVGLNIQGFHPWVVLDTYAPSPHARMGFHGEDFASNEEVLVYLNQQTGEPIMRIQTDALGRIVAPAAWEVPKLSGENTLSFVGQSQKSGVMVITSFTIAPKAMESTPPGSSVLQPTGMAGERQDDPKVHAI